MSNGRTAFPSIAFFISATSALSSHHQPGDLEVDASHDAPRLDPNDAAQSIRSGSNFISTPRSSRPKALWPLDTLLSGAQSAAQVFSGRDDERRRNADQHDSSLLHPSLTNSKSSRIPSNQDKSGSVLRSNPQPSSRNAQARDHHQWEKPLPNTPIPAACKKLSPDFQDLPVTPPDSGRGAFGMPSVADLTQPPFARVPSASGDRGSFDDFRLKKQASTAVAPESKPSKNDIFNRPSPWIAPAPAPRLKRDQPTTGANLLPPMLTPSLQRSSPASKNSLFFSSSQGPTPPPSIKGSSTSPPKPLAAGLREVGMEARQLPTGGGSQRPISSPGPSTRSASSGHTKKPSLGRANTEEREREQARIRQTKDVEFRLCPTKEYLLGEGRHCNVYLGSYWSKKKADQDSESSSTALRRKVDGEEGKKMPDWDLCAIKRLHADRHSQLLGLDEGFALRRLGAHPNLIKLIDIRDEVEFTPSPQPSPRSDLAELGKGRPSAIRVKQGTSTLEEINNSEVTPSGGGSGHGRSTSDMTGKAEISETNCLKRALAADKEQEEAATRGIEVGFPSSSEAKSTRHTSLAFNSLSTEGKGTGRSEMPIFRIAAPEEEAKDGKQSSLDVPQLGLHLIPSESETAVQRSPVRSPISSDPPRLLILLELLPHSLSNYAKWHPDRVDLEQWIAWAKEMVAAVEWLHSKGCIHADIKKENMLLTEDLSIKLCDFNSALFPSPSDPPNDGMGLGTPAYGAPELSKANGQPEAPSFSFPIDIYSLGAVLYSLATGVEPFSQARSVVEMVHRKRAFFESEENARTARHAVEGSSASTSRAASRKGSVRGRKKDIPRTEDGFALSPGAISRSLAALLQGKSPNLGTSMRRGGSADSIDSVASSITISGRNASSAVIARLLDPAPEPKGLLADGSDRARKGLLGPTIQDSGPERRASMGKTYKQTAARYSADMPLRSPISTTNMSAAARSNLLVPTRPDTLRRRSSYGDEINSAGSSNFGPGTSTSSRAAGGVPPRIEEVPTSPIRPSQLRSMAFPSDFVTEEAGSSTPPQSISPRTPTRRDYDSDDDQDERMPDSQDVKPYYDGSPALILPGGGRLPDEARELVRLMLQANPADRPTAKQVKEALEKL